MLNRIFSNTACKLLLVIGLAAFIACFFIKGKKRAIPIVVCILSLCLYLVTAGISGRANHLISQQVGQEPVKISDMNAQEAEEVFHVAASENENGERDDPEIEVTAEEFMNEFGAVVSVPEDIEILEYRIDSETQRGFVAFYKDGIL